MTPLWRLYIKYLITNCNNVTIKITLFWYLFSEPSIFHHNQFDISDHKVNFYPHCIAKTIAKKPRVQIKLDVCFFTRGLVAFTHVV